MSKISIHSLSQQWSFLKHYFIPYRVSIFTGLIFVIISTALDQVGPWILKWVVDHLEQGGDLSQIWIYLGIFLGISTLSAVLLFFQRYLVIIASRNIEYNLRNKLFQTLQFQDRNFFDSFSIGDSMSRSTNDLDHVRELVGPVVLHSIRMVLILIYTGVCLFLLNPWMALIGLGTSITLPLLSLKFLKFIYKNHRTNQEYLSKINEFVQETFQASGLIKAFGAESFFQKDFNNRSADFRDTSKKVALVTAVIWPSIGFLAGIGLCASIFLGSYLLVNDKITLGELSACILYIVKVQFPLVGLGWVLSLIQRGRGSLDRIMVLFSATKAIPDSQIIFEPEFKTITLTNLNFSIEGKPLLKNINLKVTPGKKIGLVGATGAGKTLLTNVIMGVYGLEHSGLQLNEKPIETKVECFRKLFAIAPQDGFLFSETIRSNIELGSSKNTKISVEECAKLASLTKDLKDIPEGLNAALGEKGINLSGGQKQRISLARALHANAPILILDDTLSALDTETESEILHNLNSLKSTALIISHRYSSVKECDEIIVLDQGEIVERGNHSKLIKLKGKYSKTWNQQTISSDLEQI